MKKFSSMLMFIFIFISSFVFFACNKNNDKITSLSVNNTDMNGYNIVTDLQNELYKNVAENMQKTFY